jgi:hypothetical protein
MPTLMSIKASPAVSFPLPPFFRHLHGMSFAFAKLLVYPKDFDAGAAELVHNPR